MKEKMSPSTKFLILLFIIPILLWRCESEENLILKEKTIEQKSFIKTIENVTLDAISSQIKKTFINPNNKYKSKSEKDIYYNFNNIVKMVDTLGNTKYSIVFQLNNQPKNVHYNLIVGLEKNNREVRYVMKYTIDNLDESDEDLYNFSNFKGTVERYSYEYILKNEKRLILGAKDELIYPCLKSVSSGGGSGVTYGGHGGGGSSNNNYGGSSSGSSTTGSGIRFGFNTFYYYSGTKITGLTTEGVIDDTSNGPLVTAPVPNDCVSISNFEAIIDECDDDILPINPKCIGKKIDENGNCVSWAGIDDGLPNEWWNDDVFVENMFNKNPYNIWRNITQEERDLIKKYPHEAYAIYLNREIAEKATKEKFGGNYRNDKSDAFRHAFYSLINTNYVGITIATKFSDAHESETPTLLIKEKEMDLFNNNIGHNSIFNNSDKTNIYLANLIYTKLLNGDLRYLSPINFSDPNFNTTQGINILTELIPTNN